MRLQLLTFWNTIDTHDDFIMHFMIHFYQFNLLFKKKMGGGGRAIVFLPYLPSLRLGLHLWVVPLRDPHKFPQLQPPAQRNAGPINPNGISFTIYINPNGTPPAPGIARFPCGLRFPKYCRDFFPEGHGSPIKWMDSRAYAKPQPHRCEAYKKAVL